MNGPKANRRVSSSSNSNTNPKRTPQSEIRHGGPRPGSGRPVKPGTKVLLTLAPDAHAKLLAEARRRSDLEGRQISMSDLVTEFARKL
jgi:hypothetical protein